MTKNWSKAPEALTPTELAEHYVWFSDNDHGGPRFRDDISEATYYALLRLADIEEAE